MKKIIATVLAMVMALALCTTAFAVSSNSLTATDYGFYKMSDNTSFVTTTKNDTLTYYAEEKSTSTVDGKTTVTIVPAYYWLHTASSDCYFVCVDVNFADVKVAKDSKVVDYVLHTNVVPGDTFKTSDVVAKTFKGVESPSCAQWVDGTYYVINAEVYRAPKSTETATGYALLNGKVVGYVNAEDTCFHDHAFDTTKTTTDKGVVTSILCTTCEKYIPVVKKIPADSLAVYEKAGSTINGVQYYYLVDQSVIDNAGSADSSTTTSATSPKTFDAGIAMYVGMALTSVAGSAVVIGKKKEF